MNNQNVDLYDFQNDIEILKEGDNDSQKTLN